MWSYKEVFGYNVQENLLWITVLFIKVSGNGGKYSKYHIHQDLLHLSIRK